MILHAEYTEWRQNDFNVHDYHRPPSVRGDRRPLDERHGDRSEPGAPRSLVFRAPKHPCQTDLTLLPTRCGQDLHTEADGGAAHFSQALSYNPADDSWSRLPAPPWMAGRGMGACTANSLYLVAGANTATPNYGCSVARLSKTGGAWAWTMLPPLPLEGYRYSGSAGVVGNYLVVAGAKNSTYRLYLPTAAHGKPWEKMADFPDAGLQGSSNDGVVNGSLYIFGGGSADTSAAAIAAFGTLYALKLPVPIVTNMAACTRKSWRYDTVADTWHRLPDCPYHVERGGSVVLGGRYIVNLGSTHNKDSFRVGMNCLVST